MDMLSQKQMAQLKSYQEEIQNNDLANHIATYKGYSQEDKLVFNNSPMERGKYNPIYAVQKIEK